jgi:hypothetical protein
MSMNYSPRFTPSNRPGSAKKSPSMRTISKPLPSWNTYLTDDNYKISEEELLKRKQMHMSKHNILLDGGAEKTKRTIKKKIVKKQPKAQADMDNDSVVSELEAHDRHIDAIDMLDDEEESRQQRGNKENKQNGAARPSFCSTVKTRASSTPRAVRLPGTPSKPPSRAQYFHHQFSSPSPVAQTDDASEVSVRAGSAPRAPVSAVSVTHGLEGGGVLDEDLEDILAQIEMLTGEMQYYEELSGRKNIFNFDVSRPAGHVPCALNRFPLYCLLMCVHVYVRLL